MAEKHPDKIPQHEINALARCLLPEIQKFFASPEGQKEFEEWKAQDRVPNVGVRGRFPGCRKQGAVIA